MNSALHKCVVLVAIIVSFIVMVMSDETNVDGDVNQPRLYVTFNDMDELLNLEATMIASMKVSIQVQKDKINYLRK